MTNFDQRNQQVETQYNAARDINITLDSSVVNRQKYNRIRMLDKVQFRWITSILDKPLHGAAPIILGLDEQPDTVDAPWKDALHHPDEISHTFSPGTPITQVYNNAKGELLILGESGSGKTTLLLELTRDLLDRARQDETHPIPVVFNLSSWADKQQPLCDWLIEELHNSYQIPKKLGKTWVDTDQVMPLLDGLDRVPRKYFTKCINTINAYRQEHGQLPTVVCCRIADYLAQKRRLLLHNAIVVQPLTIEQIDAYLSNLDEQFVILRSVINNDPMLQELAKTPLMLSILPLAYQGESIKTLLATNSPATQRNQILATYIRRMIRGRGATTRYGSQQIEYWLAWLAKQMTQHNQTEFYIERMQPDWLPEGKWRKQHGFFVFLTIAAIAILLGVLWFVVTSVLVPASGWINILTAIIIAIFGVFNGLRYGTQQHIEPAERVTWSWIQAQIKANSVNSILGKSNPRNIRGWLPGLAFCCASGVFFLRLAHDGFFLALLVGFIIWLVLEFGFSLYPLMLHGFSSDTLDEHTFDKPNQGISRSAKHGLIFGFIGASIIALLIGICSSSIYIGIFGLPLGLTLGIYDGLGFGVILGQYFGLRLGGAAYIQHIFLRWLLWRAHYAPLNYSGFLDYAAERILLRKIGGGYIFFHQLVQDYFVMLNTTLTTNDMKKQSPEEDQLISSKFPKNRRRRRYKHYSSKRGHYKHINGNTSQS